MTDVPDNVEQLDARRRLAGGNNGGSGHDLEGRVRKLEVDFARFDERISGLEKTIDRSAAELEKTIGQRIDHLEKSMASKVWVLGGVIGGGVLAASLVLTAAKFFSG